MQTTDRTSEFRRGWRVLFAASLGVAFGASPIPFNSLGAFTVPIASEFGWGRGQIQLALFCFTVAVVLTVPIVGGLADKLGVRRVAIATLTLFGITFAAIGLTPASLAGFYGLWALSGALGGGSTPVTWTRAVNGWFVINRGLALALTLIGTGITAAFLPSLAVFLIERFGWRLAFLGVALLPLAVALPIALFFFRDPPLLAASNAEGSAFPAGGLTLRQAMRKPQFWLLAGSILCVALVIAGTITNLQPLLRDKGFTAGDAARIAGAIGVSIICGRLLAGYLIDRFWAPGITFPMLLLPAIACIVLTRPEISPASALVAAICIGFASGAETDLVAFLSAKYFGLAHYGKIYGVQYAVFGFVSGIAPFIFGRMFDQFGNYNAIFYIAAVMLVVGALMLLVMGRYPQAASDLHVGAQHHHAR